MRINKAEKRNILYRHALSMVLKGKDRAHTLCQQQLAEAIAAKSTGGSGLNKIIYGTSQQKKRKQSRKS